MVETATQTRTERLEALKVRGADILANREKMPLHKEDASCQFRAHLEMRDGCPLIVCSMYADGYTVDMHKWYDETICDL